MYMTVIWKCLKCARTAKPKGRADDRIFLCPTHLNPMVLRLVPKKPASPKRVAR